MSDPAIEAAHQGREHDREYGGVICSDCGWSLAGRFLNTETQIRHHQEYVEGLSHSDPVADAAQRAWEEYEAEGGIWKPDALKLAAREVLKPIQEWVAEIDSYDMLPGHVVIAALAPMIYSTEELGG